MFNRLTPAMDASASTGPSAWWGLRTTWLSFLSLVVLGVIAALYLLQANQIAATISDIHRLDDEAEQLRQDNAALIVEIATLEDINHLKGRAVELGFGPSTNLHYLRVPSYSTASPPQ